MPLSSKYWMKTLKRELHGRYNCSARWDSSGDANEIWLTVRWNVTFCCEMCQMQLTKQAILLLLGSSMIPTQFQRGRYGWSYAFSGCETETSISRSTRIPPNFCNCTFSFPFLGTSNGVHPGFLGFWVVETRVLFGSDLSWHDLEWERSRRSRSVLVRRGLREGIEATITHRLSSTMAHSAADVSLTILKIRQLSIRSKICLSSAIVSHTLGRSRVFFEREQVATAARLTPVLHKQDIVNDSVPMLLCGYLHKTKKKCATDDNALWNRPLELRNKIDRHEEN